MDDQAEVARALSRILSLHCEVIEAHSAEQGASLLHEGLCAVLTDYDMPGRNEAIDDLMAAGTMAEAKKLGKLRLEGKTYPVQDGDILNIRSGI